MNIFEQLIFYAFAGLTVLSALVILFTRHVLYAAFSLIVTFLGVSAIYVFAGADFIAVAQVLVYVGGILVLMIFGVMLTNKISGQAVTTESHNRFSGGLLGVSMFALLLYGILRANIASLTWINEAQASGEMVEESTIQLLGVKLMSNYILPFEVAAILLLVALIGAAYIAQRQID